MAEPTVRTPDPRRAHLIFAVLAVGAVSFSLLSSLVAPALPEIQRELHASTNGTAWIFTSYLLSLSVVTPIAGRLGDMFGKKRVLIVTLGFLVLASVVAAVATSLLVLIAARVIQGFGGGIFPLAYGIIRDEFPRERVPVGVALISATFGLGASLGTVLAGPIVEQLSWHWLFWVPLVPLALVTVVALFVIPESAVRVPGQVDWIGALLMSAWLVCLLVAVSEARVWAWGSARTIGLIALAAVLALAWTRLEARSREPLVDMRMMRLRGVWTANAAGLLFGVGIFSSLVFVPVFVAMPAATGYGFGASVTKAGLFLVPMMFAMPLTSMIAARLSATTVGSRLPLIVGALASTLGWILLAAAHAQEWEIYLATGVLGVGAGLSFAAMSNLIVEAVPPEQTGVAVGMNTIMRTIGGSLGTQLLATIISSNVLASGLPSERGFVIAFFVAAALVSLGFLASLAVPRAPRLVRFPAPTEATAD